MFPVFIVTFNWVVNVIARNLSRFGIAKGTDMYSSKDVDLGRPTIEHRIASMAIRIQNTLFQGSDSTMGFPVFHERR